MAPKPNKKDFKKFLTLEKKLGDVSTSSNVIMQDVALVEADNQSVAEARNAETDLILRRRKKPTNAW